MSSSSSRSLPALLLLLLVSSTLSTTALGSRRSPVDAAASRDFALDLNSTTFHLALADSPARFAVVEFFAHWCPACRNYKPQYEKVAKLFNGPDAVHPGFVVMTRVDCANKMNVKLCSRFSVTHYPMLFWGPPTKFVSGRWDPKEEHNEIKPIDSARTAELLLAWINKQLGSTFTLKDERFENENTLAYNTSDPDEITRAIYDVEEATKNAIDIILDHKMIKPETRTSLIQFLQLLVVHHPSKRCRRGCSEMLVEFNDLWPSQILALSPPEAISDEKSASKSFEVCGKEVPRGYWIFCRGSKKDTRGFSCGLWILLHSLSVSVADEESQLAFTVMCNFIHDFFICEECRRHFYEKCSSVTTPFSKTRELSLWLWSTHNEVNERLMKEEKVLGTGEPKFPKLQWPPKQLCPSCYQFSGPQFNSSQADWNKDEVFNFLVRYYRKSLIPPYKDEQLDANVTAEVVLDDSATPSNDVPIGAALAIAVVICIFGVVACFWRAQPKNRKYLHQLRTVKEI